MTVWLVSIMCGCVDAPPSYPYDKEPNPLEGEYVIGVGDDLVINVWQHDEFATELAVRPDGNITIPLVGDVLAAGQTPSALKAAVTEKLKGFVKDATVVTVSVKVVNSYYVTVSGRVTSPGRISAQSYLTVGDAITLAGGPDRFASADEAFVLRKDKAGTRKIPVNYEQVVRGEHLHQNIYLMRGDQVVVP